LLLSVVIPSCNEAESLPELLSRTASHLRSLGEYEIIVVDDGSNDNTLEVVQSFLKKNEATVRYVANRRRLGKSAALRKGFATARGQIIVTMDADLQDRPEDIGSLVEKLVVYDAVVGWRKDRCDGFWKRLFSRFFNAMTRALFTVGLHDMNCGLKAIRRSALQGIGVREGHHRYLPLLLIEAGFAVGEVTVRHSGRRYGKSKYGALRLLAGLLDLLVLRFELSFSERPMLFFGATGILLVLSALYLGLYVVALNVFYRVPYETHTPLLFLISLLAIAGIQLFMMGFIADMISNMNMPSRSRGD